MGFATWLTERPIAHRGLHDGNRQVWENTLTAFARAIDGGFAIECDVNLSADGVPMVFHDSELKRLSGVDGHLHEKTAAQLSALTIGGTADRIPTLDDMLELAAGRVPLIIELKGLEGKDDGLVHAVGQSLAKYDGPSAIMSFDHWLVRQFKTQAPGIPCGLTAEGVDEAALERHFSMLAHGIDFASFDVNQLPNPFVTFMRDTLRRPVITWTVRDRAQVEATRLHADQMTFEGFDPATGPSK